MAAGGLPQAPPATPIIPSGPNAGPVSVVPITRRAFAVFCLGIGSPPFPASQVNQAVLIAWMNSEGNPLPCPSPPGPATWNPMATTLGTGAGAGNLGDCNSSHVKKYKNAAQGAAAWSETVRENQPGYSAIVAALKNGNAGPQAIQAINASGWGSHPSLSDYQAALAGGDIGNVVLGTGTLDPTANETDVGAATPGLGLDPLGLFSKLVEYVGRIFSWQTWKRILGVIAGAALILLGVTMIRRDTFAQVAGDVGKAMAIAE